MARSYGEQGPSVEAARKAVFIGRMLKFVRWPDDAGAAQGRQFEFCVAGSNNFLSFALARELRGDKVQGREIGVRQVKNDADLQGCDAMYFAGKATGRNGKWLEKLKGSKVLTVGEDDGLLDAGGMVRITGQDDVVQFEVNLDGVRTAGLKIDARLLELARGVKQGGRGAATAGVWSRRSISARACCTGPTERFSVNISAKGTRVTSATMGTRGPSV